MLPRRESMPPLPPAPALLILDRRVSAGCEMIAAVTPAITPDIRDTDTFSDCVQVLGVLPMDS